MAIQTVLQLGDPRLREVAHPVEDATAPDIRSLVQDLAETLAHWRRTTGYGRAIAAPQIAVPLRAIFLQLPGADPLPMINPEIIERSKDKIVVWDACLSFLSIFMQVERHREIKVHYQDLQGNWHEIQAGRRTQSIRVAPARNRSPEWNPGSGPHDRHKNALHPRRIREEIPS